MIDECTKARLEAEGPEERIERLHKQMEREAANHNMGIAKSIGMEIDKLQRQLDCKHEWKGDGSCMQLSTTYCDKCGALYAC